LEHCFPFQIKKEKESYTMACSFLAWLVILSSLMVAIKPSSSWGNTPSYRRKILYRSTARTTSETKKDTFYGLLLRLHNPFNQDNDSSCGRSKVSLCSTKSSSSSSSDNKKEEEDDDDDEDEEDGDDNWWNVDELEVLEEDNFFEPGTEDEAEAWIPDGEMARRKKKIKSAAVPPPPPLYQRTSAASAMAEQASQNKYKKDDDNNKPSPYTEEEQELINAMGGTEPPVKRRRRNSSSSTSSSKEKSVGGGDSAAAAASSKSQPPRQPVVVGVREEGFLGDSTISEIAMDYSVPICYLADVLCIWGVPVPINIHERLGDLITGEQAFALVEAVYSLDVGVLQDRYSNQSMVQVCDDWDIAIADAFQFAMQNGWSLPFGVQTNLRVEQEEELLRVFSTY
jgi:hypothetical protein